MKILRSPHIKTRQKKAPTLAGWDSPNDWDLKELGSTAALRSTRGDMTTRFHLGHATGTSELRLPTNLFNE